MSCTLVLHDIGYCTIEKQLFEHVSLSLSHKQKTGIIGPNGCGKSSLLKIAAGLIQPNSGHIELFHEPVRSLAEFDSHRHKIGYLFQDSDNQFIAPTVLEDVAFGPLNLGVAREEAKNLAHKQLDDLGIAHLAERVPMRLSGGEKKLVALAGVLINQPDILLLDEPGNGLDEAALERIATIISGLSCTTLIVSHDTDLLDKIACGDIYQLQSTGLHRHI